MKDLIPKVSGVEIGNFRFWFLIKMIYLVSDKTRLFEDFYEIYFERQIRGIERYRIHYLLISEGSLLKIYF
jgi:hypothetical protein